MTTTPVVEYRVRLRMPHAEQRRFIESTAKRKVIRAGRRSGKTVGAAILAVEYFLKQRRVLYATPTADQITRFWFEVKRALQEPVDHGVFYKNETEHVIELPGTSTRIRAKTAWNADAANLRTMLEIQPDFSPTGADEQGRLDQKSPITCPHCGMEFIPQ